MKLDVEKLITHVSQVSRDMALSVRALFEYVAINQQEAVTILFVTLLVALALKNFNADDPTLPSMFCRGLGLLTLWSMLVAFVVGLLAIVLGTMFDLVLQRDSSFQYYKFYTVKFLLGAQWPSVVGLSIGMLTFVFIKRFIEPLTNNVIQLGAKRSVFIDSIPDINTIQKYLFKTKNYDPRIYFSQAARTKCVFLGLDAKHLPIYVTRHIGICATFKSSVFLAQEREFRQQFNFISQF